MKLSKYSIIPFLLSIVPFLWDGHISMILNHYLSPDFFLSSHLFIIYIFILTLDFPNKYAFLYLICFGFLYDTYYFKTVGIVILTLPLLCYLLTQLGRIVKRNTYVDFLLMFLFLFLFDTINFGFALFYGFSNESVTDFIIYQLSPSIVFNLLIFIFIKSILEKLFLYLFAPFFDTIKRSYRKGVVFYIMKKRILSAVLVSGVTLSAAASVHAEDYDSQIAAADNAISNLASQQETAQAQVATIQSQVSTLRTQKSELETKNAELEKVSADLESEIQELSSKIVARQDSLAKQARSAQQNNTATSYINSILNSKSISEAITRITAISKVVTANNDMLTKQESDQKELAAKQEQNQAAINEIATNKAELETTEAGLTTQQAELEAAQVTLAAELATAQDEKTSLVSAKSTAEAVAASTAASVAQSQAIAESEAAAQAVASSEAAAFVAQSEAAATSEAVAQPSEATVSETATASEVAQEPVSSETSETTQEPTVATSEATQEPAAPATSEAQPESAASEAQQEPAAPVTSEAQPESAAPAASEAPAPASEAPAATSEAPASQAPAASEAPAPAAETPKVSAASTPNTYPVGQCTWGAKSLASWVGNYWGNAKNWIASAQAAGHSVGTTPVAGAIAVWPNDGGGYGHVAYVTSASGANSIQVMESNYAGNMSIGNYRGTFDPTSSAHGGSVYYIYP